MIIMYDTGLIISRTWSTLLLSKVGREVVRKEGRKKSLEKVTRSERTLSQTSSADANENCAIMPRVGNEE